MKIVQLTAENVKKLKVVDITPAEDLVQITGKNGSGKSSVLDSIWWALGGTSNIQSQPIRQGAESARIRLNLGEIIVTRRFSDKGSTLTVENGEGAKYSSPQKMLDELIGELSFDPLAFSNMDPKKQYDELKRIAKIEIDLDAIDAANKSDYEKRTAFNRDAKNYEVQAQGIAVQIADDAQPVDTTSLMNEMQRAADHNSEIDVRTERRSQVAEGIRTMKGKEAALTAELAKLQTQIAEDEIRLANAEPLPAKIDVAQLRAQIDQAESVKAEIQKRDNKKQYIAKAKQAQDEAEKLTRLMKAREDQKAIALQNAQMPIPNLGLNEGKVVLNGIPFEQSSSAEQLRTSVAIAMAANPKLRVIRIKDGSLLDDDGLRMIAEMARDKDYQVWIERVDSSGKIGIVMEDGSVKQVTEQEAA